MWLSVCVRDGWIDRRSGVDKQEGEVGTVKERRQEQTSTLYSISDFILTDSAPSRAV